MTNYRGGQPGDLCMTQVVFGSSIDCGTTPGSLKGYIYQLLYIYPNIHRQEICTFTHLRRQTPRPQPAFSIPSRLVFCAKKEGCMVGRRKDVWATKTCITKGNLYIRLRLDSTRQRQQENVA